MEIWIIIGVIILLAIIVISIYNRLVSLRNRRENAFADIDVQLRQRHDLIPQLLNTVKGYMKHEAETLQKVTEARTKAMSASSIDGRIEAENELTGALRGLNVQIEAYPDLKANQNFMHFQTEISDVENKLAAARRFFNSATKELNTEIQKFPAVLFSGMFGFKTSPMFDLGTDRETMEKPPEINF